VSELQSALDALATDDLDGLVAPQLLDRTALLVQAANRIHAELARTVRRADCVQAPEHDGKKSMASWLRGHLRLSAATAQQLVRNGRTLETLPAVAAACADGVVTAEQVAVLAPVATPKNLTAAAAQGVDLAEIDAVFAETAATRQHVHLGPVVHHYLVWPPGRCRRANGIRQRSIRPAIGDSERRFASCRQRTACESRRSSGSANRVRPRRRHRSRRRDAQ
jgi:hypothetical protein